jgi:hypothetical protein
MTDMKSMAVLLIVAGLGLVLVGILMLLAGGRLPWLGHLPGDIQLRGKNWSFSFPVVSCILASIILTVVINILLRLFRR